MNDFNDYSNNYTYSIYNAYTNTQPFHYTNNTYDVINYDSFSITLSEINQLEYLNNIRINYDRVADPVVVQVVEPATEIDVNFDPLFDIDLNTQFDTESITDPVVESTTESITDPVVDPDVEHATEHAVETTVESITDPIVVPVVESTTESITDPDVEHAAETTVESITDPIVVETVPILNRRRLSVRFAADVKEHDGRKHSTFLFEKLVIHYLKIGGMRSCEQMVSFLKTLNITVTDHEMISNLKERINILAECLKECQPGKSIPILSEGGGSCIKIGVDALVNINHLINVLNKTCYMSAN